MAYSPLGYSLPDLTLTATQGPVASWGGGIAVTVDVFNRGSDTLPVPLQQYQGAPNTADAGPVTINVYGALRPGAAQFLVGVITVPTIKQNDVTVVNAELVLPPIPKGFAPYGEHIYLSYLINPTESLGESNYRNNAFFSRAPVLIEPALPDLYVVGFQTPAALVPGDTITPSIRLENVGSANTASQGPLLVQVVASQTPTYGPASVILASYVVTSLPGLSDAPSTIPYVDDLNLTPGANIITLANQTFKLPTTPATYYLGVKVNPLGTIKELANHNSPVLDAFVRVGPGLTGLPASSTLGGTTSPVAALQFPFPLGAIYANPTLNTTGVGPLIANPGAVSPIAQVASFLTGTSSGATNTTTGTGTGTSVFFGLNTPRPTVGRTLTGVLSTSSTGLANAILFSSSASAAAGRSAATSKITASRVARS